MNHSFLNTTVHSLLPAKVPSISLPLKRLLLVSSFAAGALTSAQAGGLYLTEISANEVALTGAGRAARAQDASTAFTNPGAITELEGTQMEFTVQPMFISTSFKADEGADSDLDSWLPGGSFFVTHQLDEKWSVGLSLAGFFGLGLDYDSGWEGRYHLDEVKLQSVGLQPTLGYKVNDWLSVGAGVALLYTDFEQKVAVNNLGSSDDGELKLDDTDLSGQVNLGILFKPFENTRIGVQYLSESDVKLKTKPKFSGLNPATEAALGAAGALDSKVDLEMTLPQSLTVSAFQQVTDDFAIMGSVAWQEWSQFGKVDLAVQGHDSKELTADRNYNDTWDFSAGMQYQLTDVWRLNTGVTYTTAMVDNKDVTPDLPTADSWKYGLGASYQYSENLTFNAGYEIVWYGDVDMHLDGGALTHEVDGTYEDYALHFFSITVNWRL